MARCGNEFLTEGTCLGDVTSDESNPGPALGGLQCHRSADPGGRPGDYEDLVGKGVCGIGVPIAGPDLMPERCEAPNNRSFKKVVPATGRGVHGLDGIAEPESCRRNLGYDDAACLLVAYRDAGDVSFGAELVDLRFVAQDRR